MKQLYSLRQDFTIIGITGKTGSGCSKIAELLSKENFNKNLTYLEKEESNDTDELKLNLCVRFLQNDNNWNHFKILNYKDVLLFHLFYEAIKFTENKTDAVKKIISLLIQDGDKGYRLDRISKNDKAFLEEIKAFLEKSKFEWYYYPKKQLTCDTLKDCLSEKKDCKVLNKYFFEKDGFEGFSKEFFSKINQWNLTKRMTLTHDLANNLREFGTVKSLSSDKSDLINIYTVAETINRLIKNWKRHQGRVKNKIVIDSLKNSLELMFFKEKYSAFYTIATNKSEIERKSYLHKRIQTKFSSTYDEDTTRVHVDNMIKLSDSEYKGSEVNRGNFSSPDIENCIQKSDYHIFFSEHADKKSQKVKRKSIEKNSFYTKLEKEKLIDELLNYPKLSLIPQLVKLIALIHHPGIVTPTAIERIMQIAYNAKANSGCISRQVGAVVTDESYSIKAVGWNDIPRYQIPCSLRNVTDLINKKNPEHFSDFEKGEGGNYEDGQNFKDKISADHANLNQDELEGLNCSFCFKTFHNAYEGEKNQVHTRSLHAEENAMLQISKYGGQGLKNGNLFTTASPCELCSKKAFQLGIKRIYYIDPYPGIATKHILKNTVAQSKKPVLCMFQGASGKAFHKLYDPFMSHKDELAIRTKIKAKTNKNAAVDRLTSDNEKRKLIYQILNKDLDL